MKKNESIGESIEGLLENESESKITQIKPRRYVSEVDMVSGQFRQYLGVSLFKYVLTVVLGIAIMWLLLAVALGW